MGAIIVRNKTILDSTSTFLQDKEIHLTYWAKTGSTSNSEMENGSH